MGEVLFVRIKKAILSKPKPTVFQSETDHLKTQEEYQRRPLKVTNRRRVLAVFPRYAHSFGTMQHSYELVPGVQGFMPPQGLLVVVSYLPKSWEVLFVDENIRRPTDDEFDWADIVLTSGMHVQRAALHAIAERAHRHGKPVVLGGPSVSGCPEWYPDMDFIHCGELGDATDALIERLDADCLRPSKQVMFRTVHRLPLADFPVPAYQFINLDQYFIGSIQWSSGCPYRCEFCDIPELYGRNPRLKSPQQVTAELDAMLARGNPGAVYFVDDNFVGNQKAAVGLLEELVRWQKLHDYPIQFACEATLNLAKNTQILELMKEAVFATVFCGIETPEEDALKFIHKEQNLRRPLLESIQTINRYGIEVVSGIIIGLDTDTDKTAQHMVEFVRASNIPMLTVNMLHALPKTPLWRRLEEENRINVSAGRESNVEFLRPYESVVADWLHTVTTIFSPDEIYQRFEYQMFHTYPNRKQLPPTKTRVNWRNIKKALSIFGRIVWQVGIKSDYRWTFWKYAVPALRRVDIEGLLQMAIVSHHMILFARECVRGEAEKCFYAPSMPGESEQVVLKDSSPSVEVA